MTQNIASAAPKTAAPAPSVGHRTAQGFAFFMLLSALTLGVQAINQLVLAYLLTPRHFKLITLVFTVTAFASLLQQFGIRTVLVQRFREFERLSTPGFWISALMGLVALGLTAAAAPWAARFYDEPELTRLLIVAAFQLPLISLTSVPEARLSAEMRYKYFAKLGAITILLNFFLAVLLAWRGWGPYSVIVAQVASSGIRLALLWWSAGVPIGLKPALREWPSLVRASTTLLLASLAMMVSYQGHNIVLGRGTRESDILGAFALAYSLSDQATRTLMLNLAGVLMPALATLQDEPRRQADGFLKAVRGLMLIGFPLCFLQAVVGAPLFHVILPPKWQPGIGPFVIFSVAMLGRLVLGSCESMFMAQGRRKAWLGISVAYAAGYVVAAVSGMWLGSEYGDAISRALGWRFGPAEGCAVGVAVALNIVTPLAMKASITPAGGTWGDVWRDYRFPLLASAGSAAAAWGVTLLLPTTKMGDVARLVVAPAVMGALYLVLVRMYARREAYELLGRVQKLLPEKMRSWLRRHAAIKGMVLGEAQAVEPMVMRPEQD